MQRFHKTLVVFLLFVASSPLVFGQTSANDPRRVKPAAELERLHQFLGSYTTTMDMKGRKLPGTMEVKTVVGGWYVERINYSKSDDGTVDSEIRSLITWDPAERHYRIWRFVQLTPQKKHDGIGRFVDDAFVEEFEFEGTGKGNQILRNRITMPSKNEMRIVNEIQSADGTVALRGVIVAKRR